MLYTLFLKEVDKIAAKSDYLHEWEYVLQLRERLRTPFAASHPGHPYSKALTKTLDTIKAYANSDSAALDTGTIIPCSASVATGSIQVETQAWTTTGTCVTLSYCFVVRINHLLSRMIHRSGW
jgi:hypothetical protein